MCVPVDPDIWEFKISVLAENANANISFLCADVIGLCGDFAAGGRYVHSSNLSEGFALVFMGNQPHLIIP